MEKRVKIITQIPTPGVIMVKIITQIPRGSVKRVKIITQITLIKDKTYVKDKTYIKYEITPARWLSCGKLPYTKLDTQTKRRI